MKYVLVSIIQDPQMSLGYWAQRAEKALQQQLD